jgi:hypothetical protein
MEIRSAKLISGEIVIGEKIIEDDNTIVFKDLLQLTMVPQSEKSVRMGFLPLHPFFKLKDQLTIKKNHILLWIDCPKEISVEYEKYINPSKIVKPVGPKLIV